MALAGRDYKISKESQKSSSKDETLEVVLDDKTMKLIDDYVDKKINNETDNDDFLRLLMLMKFTYLIHLLSHYYLMHTGMKPIFY